MYLGKILLTDRWRTSIQTRTIKGKKVHIKYIKKIDDISGIHLLFISPTPKKILDKIVDYTKGKPILTISDSRGYAENGVQINFFMQDNNVCFEINNQSAITAGLTINYLLLESANNLVAKKEGE